MNRFNYFLSVGLASTLFVAGPSPRASAEPAAQSSAAKADDSALESQIEANLKNNSVLAPRDIDVDVKQGVVTLTGSVRTSSEKSSAGKIANIKGVARVNNQIEVDPKIDKSKIEAAGEKTKSGLNKAVDATVKSTEKAKEGVQKGVGKAEQGVGVAADKTSDAIAKAGDKTNDASITTRVKAGFTGESLLKESAIDVDTNDHVVTLKGTVPSVGARDRAATVASGISGVTRVINQLVVKVD